MEELMLSNCGVGEDSWESLGLQGDPTSPFWRRSALGFLWRTDAKAGTPVLWPPHVKSWLIGKDSDAGRDWRQEEKGTTEDEMAGWHYWLDGCESEWTPGVGDGQGGLACCNSWGHKELNTIERLNWTELGYIMVRVGQWAGTRLWRNFTSEYYSTVTSFFTAHPQEPKAWWEHPISPIPSFRGWEKGVSGLLGSWKEIGALPSTNTLTGR